MHAVRLSDVPGGRGADLRRAVTLLVVATSAAIGTLLVAEAATRLLDGYSLTELRLPPFAPAPGPAPAPPDLATLAAPVGGAPDVDPRWIDDVPPRAKPQVDPDLLALRSRLRHAEVPAYNLDFVWNALWVNEHG